MNRIYSLIAVAAIGAVAAGCSEETYDLAGEGTVKLSARISSDVTVVSRADTEAELSEKCILWISNSGGAVRKYQGLNNLPAEGITLRADRYVAEAWTGDSVSASFYSKYYKGREEFTVEASKTSSIEMVCKIANTVASVDYDPNIDDVLTDYSLTIGHTRGQLTFEGRDDRKGYFMMPSGQTALTYTFTGKKADGSTFTHTGEIASVKPTTEYRMHIKAASDDSEIGGGVISIVIDETEIVVNDVITIATAPQITGYGFDLSHTLNAEPGNVGRRSVWVLASTELQSVVLAADNLSSLLGISGNDVDFYLASDVVKDQIKTSGITTIAEYNPESGCGRMKISFESTLLNKLPAGTQVFTITARDKDGRTTSANMTINVSDAKIVLTPVAPDALTTYATSATISAEVVKDAENPWLEYRRAGTTEWTKANTTVTSRAGATLTAVITGLTPGTVYEYRACDTDGYTSPTPLTFTTEAAQQLENAGFEEWNTSSTPYLIYTGSMYWDSGNHGSKTMGKNVTEPSSTVKHSGNYSAALKSQFVGVGALGKFAAGNCFVGKYLATDGTDGVLGWGRPFTSRPVKLHGWAKYEPVTIDCTTSGYTPPADIVKGQMDKGIVYVALVDNTKLDPSTSSEFPVVVKTKKGNQQLFNKDASNVIAYGEMVWHEATPGSDMVEFEIPLTYRRTDVRPSYIIVTCSASKGGDYFAGGNGSTLYLDDFELIY